MDELTKLWMYHNWMEDTNEEHIKLRNQACLIGSFWNADAARKIMEQDENTISVTDEDFEKATQYMIEKNKQLKESKKRKKKRRKIKLKNKGLDG